MEKQELHIDFEAANSKLAAILGTTKGEIKDLTADARRLGEATKYTASEATNLQIELSKLGFSKTEILDMTEGVLKFAQATGAELPKLLLWLVRLVRMFGADTEETVTVRIRNGCRNNQERPFLFLPSDSNAHRRTCCQGLQLHNRRHIGLIGQTGRRRI